MDESPRFIEAWINKTGWVDNTRTYPNDPTWIKKIEELFRSLNGKDIVWKMSGMEYRYIFVTTPKGWSLSEERKGDDGITYYQTINMRNGTYELFKNTVNNGKESPGKIGISIEVAKDIIGDMHSKIIIMNVGKQVSTLENSISFA